MQRHKLNPFVFFVLLAIFIAYGILESGANLGALIAVLVISALIITGVIKWRANYAEKVNDIPVLGKKVCVTGQDYEKYVASRIKAMGYHSIMMTKESGDHGADIIAYAPDGVKCAIQCKYYSKPVGNKAVQEALAGAVFYECNRAIVITNTTFTKQAIEEAQKIGVKLIARF